MAKLKREQHRLYARHLGSDPWFLVGRGNDDMSVEMNGSFEQTKDVTGEVGVSDTGYQPQIPVDPYIPDPVKDSEFADFLLDLALNRKSGDDAKAEYMEVVITDDEAPKHRAWKEDCRIEITNYGGDTSGFHINYNIWVDGNRAEGSVTYENKVPTWSTVKADTL